MNISYSQGAYLTRGQSGFGINTGFSYSQDVSGFGAAAGFSISGIYDLGLFVGRFSLDENPVGYDISVIVLQPGVTFHLIKQDTTGTPLSVALSAAYERDFYSTSAGLTLTGKYLSFGTSIYRNLYLSPYSYLQPSAGVFYITGSTKLADRSGNSQTVDNNTNVLALSSAFVFRGESTSGFVIEPAAAFSEENTTFSISIGFFFSTTR